MNRLVSLALGAGLALASIGLAHAGDSVAGAWKFTVGVNDAPCTLTLTPDASGVAGTIAAGADCPAGLNTVSNWKTVGTTIELLAGTNELVASLHPKDGSYTGTRFTDGRKVALSR